MKKAESKMCSKNTCDFTLYKARSECSRKKEKHKNNLNSIEIIHRVLTTRSHRETELLSMETHDYNLSPEFIRKRLKKQLDKDPPLALPNASIQRIFEKVPYHLYENWTPSCAFLLDELKMEYGKSTTDILLGTIVLVTDNIGYKKEELKLTHQEVSYNSGNVTEKRNTLEGNILYYFPFIRHLISEAQSLLPPVFIDCEKYSGFKGFYHPEILLNMMEKEIDREDLRMEFDWFGKIFMHVSEKEFFLDWNESKVSRFITLIIQITKTIALGRIYDTLQALVTFFTDPKTTPKIAVQVYHSFDGHIIIIPTASDIYSSYCNLIKRVYDMGKNFVHFEMFHLKEGRRGYISLEKYDDIKNTYENKIKDFVIGIYQNMTDYYKKTSNKYLELIDDSQTSYDRLSSMNMEELITMADHYITLKGNINEIDVNTYFPHFKANNKALIKSLLFITECRTDQIMNEVLKFHVEYCERNCKEFCSISQKAVKVPETTEELISLAKFMKFVSTDHMRNLRDSILSYLVLFYRVMEIVTVPQSYLDMMGLVLGWVSYMESVIHQNSSMLEVSTAEFEECLNKVTEKLNEDLENFSSDELDGLDHLDDYTMINNYTLHIMKCLRKVQHFEETAKWINKEESLFEMTLSTYPELDEIKAFVNPFAKLVFQLYNWNMVYQSIMDGSLENLTLESVEKTLEENNNLVYQLQKWFKSKIRQQTNENNPRRFKGNVDDSEYDNWPAPMKLLHGAQKNLDEIKDHKNFIKLFCNPRMTAKHWESISKIAERDMTPYKGSSLRQFINFRVDEKMEQFEVISESAIKEYNLKENLINMKDEWKNVYFLLRKSTVTSIVVLDTVDHIQSLIDNHLVKSLSIRSSSFVKPIEDDLKTWYSKLGLLNVTIEEWCRVQKQWLYFMPIFSSKVISDQMQTEGALFKDVNKSYRQLLGLVQKSTLVMSIIDNDDVLPTLKICLRKFEQINVGVKKYLEKKRLFFARFFFLSDEQVLQFLSETRDPKNTQIFLKKCFSGISKLGFDDLLNIRSIMSSEGEEIKLTNKVNIIDANGSVEKWLVQLEDQMVTSVRALMKKSLEDYKMNIRQTWIHTWPGQIVLCLSRLRWTTNIEEYLKHSQLSTLQTYCQKLSNQIDETIDDLQNQLTTFRRTTLTSLVVQDVHCREITDNLHKHCVSSASDFLWLSQLRYYWEDDVQVRILDGLVKYSYEYVGNPYRLVVTPLTERCQRTLVGAYNLHYYGATEGPTSTGKTETIKDLANAVAVYCHIFSCSSNSDITTFDKFLKGVASSGIWICFHEFDRINPEVLSVIAEQMLCITQAVRQNMSTFMFNGTSLTLNPSCFISVTINPGYTGRSELPCNLKVLFRPVAMMVPDFSLIGEIFLFSNGFKSSKVLATKVVTMFKLCSAMLPQSTHYDFGLRTMILILKTAKIKKIEYYDQTEDEIIIKSIISVALPRIAEQHISLFKDIIHDTFPSTSFDMSAKDLSSAVLQACKERNLQTIEKFVNKVNQANELMKINHSVIFIGEPYSGKSTALKILHDVNNISNMENNEKVEICINVINPIAVLHKQLYGFFNDSFEWTDGIVGKLFREFTKSDSTQKNWVIFDGPISSTWIENLNTALGNNVMLCLNNGEIIEITPTTSIIFESTDLLEASPATISRCGIVYFESKTLRWEAIIKSWNETLPKSWTEDKPDRFISLLNWLIPSATSFISKHCVKKIDLGIEQSVRSVCQIIEIMLNDTLEGQDLKYINAWSQAIVMQSVLWCFAGALDRNSREKFDEHYRQEWKVNEESNRPANFCDDIEIVLPNDGLIEDNSFIYKAKGAWKYWPEVLKSMKYDDVYNPRTNLVTTVDSLKYSAILELFVKHQKPFLLFGQPGTGKTSFIHNLLVSNANKNISPSFFSFTTSTTVTFTQELVLSKLIKKSKGVYAPSGDKKCIMFVDDIHMLQRENNSWACLELLRQFFDHGYWYDQKNLEKIFLRDIIFVASMTLQNGVNYIVPNRFLRHFTPFCINAFSDETLTKIFTTIVYLGLRKNGFPTDVMTLTQQVVLSTLTIYNSIINNIFPIPRKCHYLFNIRDMMRVFQGFLLLRKESADGKKAFIRLWTHEILRVFYDRLVDNCDKNWLFDEMRAVVEECYKEEFDLMLDGLDKNEDTMVSQSTLSNLIFTTAFDIESQENAKYEEITTFDSFYNLAFKMLDEFNASSKKQLNIILFKYALEHVSHICRIMTVPNGNGVLIGVNGTGRQSLVKLAAYMLRQAIYQPEKPKNIDNLNWKKDIKNILKLSGAENKQCVLLLNESQLKINFIMEDVNALLNTGEIPNLYAVNEMQDIVEMVRSTTLGNGNSDINTFTVFEHFISCCKKNLHIILCMSPNASDFRSALRMFPSIVNNSTVDWFETEWILNMNGRQLKTTGWPEDALERVAKEYFVDIDLEGDQKEQIINACKYFHVSARAISKKFLNVMGRKTYISSDSYIDLLEHYQLWVKKKKDELELTKGRYLGGLDKLEFAACQVEIMQKDLESLQPALKKAAEETSEMLKVIETETFEVEKASERVRLDEEIANVQAMGAMELKTECENDLALAIPILEDAVAALNTLKPADITLVKSMKNPPETVKLVLAAVCVMRGIKPDRLPDPKNPGRRINDYWGPSKRLLGDMSFLQQLKDYDKDNIPASTMKAVRAQYLNHKDFKPKVVAKASSAAEGLCKWVIALDKYDVVVKEVAPKKEKLRIAEKEYSETMAILEAKRNLLKGLEDKLAELKDNLKDANERKIRLQNEVVLCSNKLQKAQRIIGSLGGEKERWEEIAENLKKQFDEIPGNIIISCSIIAYLSSFTPDIRKNTIDDWCKLSLEMGIPLSTEYSLQKALGSTVLIEQWSICGLPNDSFSIENAIILHSSKRWSLLLDPQCQANKWIKNVEANNGLRVIRSIENETEMIKLCVQTGRPLLFESHQEDLEPLPDLLCKKYQAHESGEYFIDGSAVQVHKSFQLYITTKLSNPEYPPDIHTRLTVINFCLTVDGLADQLLEIVISKERPEMQEKRGNLLLESSKNKKDLQTVEDSILKTLSSVVGNILEDEHAVNSLDNSKAIAEEIKKKELFEKQTRDDIEQFRQEYKTVGDHCATLYYTITNLSSLDPMYQYSLNWFLRIFTISIDSAPKSNVTLERIPNLKEMFNYSLYVHISYTLFQKHRILYSFILCTTLLKMESKIDPGDIDLLIGSYSKDQVIMKANPAEEWLPDDIWLSICRISTHPSFQGFNKCFEECIDTWKTLYSLPILNTSNVNIPWFQQLPSFKKIVILNILRPDRLLSELSLFVKTEIGEKFIIPPTFDIKRAFNESTNTTPLIIMSSPGSDPMQALFSFVKKERGMKKLTSISIGKLQENQIQVAINEAKKTGNWVCFQNCHLSANWMAMVERITDTLYSSDHSLDFRLWLTTNSSPDFPKSILQYGIKIVNEEPFGLKENLYMRYTTPPTCDLRFYESCPGKENLFTRLLFSVAFFHAIVCERRKFGPIGWSIPYGFDESDYLTSISQLQNFVCNFEESTLSALLYLIGECNYGGKVTDHWDKRTLDVLLEQFINQEVITTEQYSFIKNSEVYKLPVRSDYKDFIQCIKILPSVSLPEVHGLHSNAGVAYELEQSNIFISGLNTIFGEYKEPEPQESFLLSVIKNILSKVPVMFDLDEAERKYPADYGDSMNMVLVLEMAKLNDLSSALYETTNSLLMALKGLSKLTPELEEISRYLLRNEVPKVWSSVSYPSLKSLGSFIVDFNERKLFLEDWYSSGILLDYWISGLSFPQAFLTGIIQKYARENNLSIDNITFNYDVLETNRAVETHESGVTVYGIYLNGAHWNRDRHHLEEEYPMTHNDKLPALWVKPILKENEKKENKFLCPLFITPARNGKVETVGNTKNCIRAISLTSKEPPSHWVKRGVAMTCQIID